jgi:hypothetical protein
VANRPAQALGLRDGDRDELVRLIRSSSVRAGLAQRARIVLLAADGVSNTAIAELVGVSRPTVIGWRDRYQRRGLAGLVDEPRPGRPRSIDHAAIITATLKPPPKRLGTTHWSTRLLAKQLGISDATVAKAWRDYRVQPWRAESFRFSTDPELVGKVTDVVGLYLAPPENAIVLCVDEKSQIQALDRTAPILPLQPGLAERRSHDYLRHGTSTLFAALEIATGTVTAACKPRHRHQEFLAFLRQVARALPRPGAAPGDGQLRRSQAPEGEGLAGGEPAGGLSLHPDPRLLDEPRRGVVLTDRTPSHPPRQLRLRERPQRQDPRLHHRLERPLPSFRLDQDSRPDPEESQP